MYPSLIWVICHCVSGSSEKICTGQDHPDWKSYTELPYISNNDSNHLYKYSSLRIVLNLICSLQNDSVWSRPKVWIEISIAFMETCCKLSIEYLLCYFVDIRADMDYHYYLLLHSSEFNGFTGFSSKELTRMSHVKIFSSDKKTFVSCFSSSPIWQA